MSDSVLNRAVGTEYETRDFATTVVKLSTTVVAQRVGAGRMREAAKNRLIWFSKGITPMSANERYPREHCKGLAAIVVVVGRKVMMYTATVLLFA